jgi:hypothetical protein
VSSHAGGTASLALPGRAALALGREASCGWCSAAAASSAVDLACNDSARLPTLGAWLHMTILPAVCQRACADGVRTIAEECLKSVRMTNAADFLRCSLSSCASPVSGYRRSNHMTPAMLSRITTRRTSTSASPAGCSTRKSMSRTVNSVGAPLGVPIAVIPTPSRITSAP